MRVVNEYNEVCTLLVNVENLDSVSVLQIATEFEQRQKTFKSFEL